MMDIKYLEYVKPSEHDIFVYDRKNRYPFTFVYFKELGMTRHLRYKTSRSLEGVLEIARKDKKKNGPKTIAIYSDISGMMPNINCIPNLNSIAKYREFYIKYASARTITVSENVDQIYYESFDLFTSPNFRVANAYIFDYNILYGGARLKEDGTLYHNKLTDEIITVNFITAGGIDDIHPHRDMIVCYEDQDGHNIISAEVEEV